MTSETTACSFIEVDPMSWTEMMVHFVLFVSGGLTGP